MEIFDNKQVGDFYWAYADILRSVGLKESIYDERILAFMALKLLIDNKKLNFNFIYKDKYGHFLDVPFGINNKEDIFLLENGKINYQLTFENIINEIFKFDNTLYFIKKSNDLLDFQKFNLEKYNVESELEIIKNNNVFDFKKYIYELPEHKFLAVLDIYNNLANFENYPRYKYKNLYEDTITRMKKLAGSLTGQHFTQTCIINLMTKIGISNFNDNDKFVIYDPTCGVGSMLYDAAFYASSTIFNKLDGQQESFYLLGQEVNGPTWFLAKVFAEISGFDNFIAFGNTLTEPVLPLYLKDRSVDFVIANPPFGVDWKTDKTKVENILQQGLQDENKEVFYTVTKLNNKNEKIIVTPKISDGQWLFFMHIAKALESNKNCKALILSSTSLLSNGKSTSDDAIIRKNFIENGLVEAIIEQPESMFTNTDIRTHIWVLDKNEKNKNKIQIIKIDNDFVNNLFKNKKGKVLREIKVLSDRSINQIEKQKNGYNKQNIEEIYNIYTKKQNLNLFSKIIDHFNEDYSVLFDEHLNFYFKKENIFNDLDVIRKTEIGLSKVYINKTIKCQQKLIDDVIKSINGEIYIKDEYFSTFELFYKELFSALDEKNFQEINDKFLQEYVKLNEVVDKKIKETILEFWKITGVK